MVLHRSRVGKEREFLALPFRFVCIMKPADTTITLGVTSTNMAATTISMSGSKLFARPASPIGGFFSVNMVGQRVADSLFVK